MMWGSWWYIPYKCPKALNSIRMEMFSTGRMNTSVRNKKIADFESAVLEYLGHYAASWRLIKDTTFCLF